jgi:hypothetical protein
LLSAPTGGEIDMSLSLRMTSMSASATPALFSASKAMPADIAPSPMMAMALRSSPLCLAASAMPSAAEIEVDEWPTPKVSYSLSLRFGKPETPPCMRSAGHALAAAGEDLVRVGLVADVPDQAVFRRVEDVVQGDGQLDRAEVGRQVAAGLGDRFDQEGAQLVGQLRQLLAVQAAQVGRAVDGFKQGSWFKVSAHFRIAGGR